MSNNKGLNANLGSVLQGMFIKNLAVPVGQEEDHSEDPSSEVLWQLWFP